MKPIGYWFRHLHELLESAFEELLAADGLTRRHWQVLNTIAEGAGSRAEIADALAPFGNPAPMLDDLIGRGWVGEPIAFTSDGREAYERIREAVHGQRRRVTEGISDEEYVITHRVLERMAANLER